MKVRLLLSCLVALLVGLPPAFADCTSPAKPAGTLEYFSANKTFKFCDGADWIGVAQCGTSLGGCTTAGTLDYDTGISNFKFCDGADWVPVANTKTLGACATAGQTDYDTTEKSFKSCDGTNWQAWATVGGLVGWWKFDESSGTTAADSSVSGFDGTVNGATWQPSGGVIGGALSFDGVDDDVNLGDVFDWADGGSFSIAGWFNRQSTDGDFLVAKTSSVNCSSVNQYGISFPSHDILRFLIGDGTDSFCMETAQTFTTPGWNHFAVVFDASSTANSGIYINGMLDGGLTKTGTAESINGVANGKSLKIGEETDTDQNSFQGLLDDFRIYDRALSQAEIEALYHGGAGCQ